MGFLVFDLVQSLVDGLRLFLLASGLTLILSMMGVLNFAHASFYMLGAYVAYSIMSAFAAWEVTIFGTQIAGYWLALFVAPLVVGVLGALVQKYMLNRVQQYGILPQLILTFSLALVIGELVVFVWGPENLPANILIPESLQGSRFKADGVDIPTYRIFMIGVSCLIFIGLMFYLYRTRVGLIIQAAITHPHMVGNLGHNVPRVFMLVFGVGTMLAGVAGVVAGPQLGVSPGMATQLGPIVFVAVIIGGLGSLTGALIASLFIGVMRTVASSHSGSLLDVLSWLDIEVTKDVPFYWLLSVSTTQMSELLPYILLIIVLLVRPHGLMGNREE